jgi:Tol biopolymer transport system component
MKTFATNGGVIEGGVGWFLASLFITVICGESSFSQGDFPHPELHWRTIETPHFFVHYHDGAERTARVVAKVAEEIYEPVTSLYNHKPDQKVSFVIKDHDDYSNGAAYFYDNMIEIWASSMDFDLRGTHNWLRNVVTHEFVHIVQIQTLMKFGRRVPAVYFQFLGYEAERRPDVLYGYPNTVVSYPISGFVLPSWFAEGVAQYNRPELRYDFWDTHRDMILRMYALDGNMLSWNEMAVFGKTSLGNESSYNAGFAFVHHIADKYGEDRLAEISRNLSSLAEFTIDGAMTRSLGKSGKEVYDEWVRELKDQYESRSFRVRQHLVVGDTIASIGFGNFYPKFSPDGRQIAYVSNKEADYFSQSSLYVYDVDTRKERTLQTGVRSNLSWSSNGNKIYYAKTTRENKHWSAFHDLYVYDIPSEKESRLTHGLRANAPAISRDGTSIAFVAGSDGTLNLFAAAIDTSTGFLAEDRDVRQLTFFRDGEQVYNPTWSTNGEYILFDYSVKDGRDIARVPASGGEVQFVIAGSDDARNAACAPDGFRFYFASDRTGIFNVYEYDARDESTRQVTNVLGGAFMPSVDSEGKLAYALYTSTGYKIALLGPDREALPDSGAGSVHYVRRDAFQEGRSLFASAQTDIPRFNWETLRTYDDSDLPYDTSRGYTSVFTSLSIVPLIRIDNYNSKNKGVDNFKPGLYAFSRDVVDRYGIFVGAAINRRLERDLFFIFNFRDRVPGLFDLGLEPEISLELYNITRKTDATATLGANTITLGVTYSLLEFDFVWKQRAFVEPLELELRFAHSRYTSTLEFPPGFANSPQIIRIDDLYFIGNDISATWTFTGITPSRTQEINPVGRKVKLRYDYEFNKFNSDNSYEIQNGVAVPLYTPFRFHRLDLSWREHVLLPGWKHTVSTSVRGGSILGPPVHQFFDFYIGGLAGMKGYPFYALGGNEMALVNLAYRFLIWENIDLRVLHLYFDKLYASVFGDVGNAWTGSPGGTRFKRDVGFEFRLESFSWYAYPTRIFFAGAYGLDSFNRFIDFNKTTVGYGREWRFYFGVLFGFDLD